MIRVSGPDARTIFARCWRGKPLSRPRFAALGSVARPGSQGKLEPIDEGLATYFAAPASYTGEDVVEFTGHGGVLVTRRVLEALVESGARLAEPGEFTQRAFLNGKLDLTQAEAVMDLISAQTDLALKAAREQLSGRLGANIGELQTDVLEVLAHVEAYIDFPEEDIDPDTGATLRDRVRLAQGSVKRLLATADRGRILREGVRTVIVGPPNVGKSSLLNRLLGFERAIVSDVPGTTRDTLEEVINVRGLPLRLVDTAGLRETEDSLEKAGMERSRHALAHAGLVLEVADGSRPKSDHIAAPAASSPRLLLLNKSDLGLDPSWITEDTIPISCATGEGLESLEQQIESLLTQSGAETAAPDSMAINTRHQCCLERAQSALVAADSLLESHQPPELVAEELRFALQSIGEIVGHTDAEDLLGVIFSRFCIGK